MNQSHQNQPDQKNPQQMNNKIAYKLWQPLLALVIIGGLGYSLLKPSSVTAGCPLCGKAAPTPELSTFDGKQFVWEKGKPTVINFWASWCGPCREEAPLFGELAKHSGVNVVGILFQDNQQESITAMINQYGLHYPNLDDPKLDAAIGFGVGGIPDTIFIDADGKVRQFVRGGIDKATLNEGLQSIGVTPLP